jgi:hypothetical protein
MRERGKGREGEATPEGESTTEGRWVGPFLSPSGSATGVMPHPLDCGPPQPEPEERWTLGPRPPERAATDDPGPAVEVERVRAGRVRTARADRDAPDPGDG